MIRRKPFFPVSLNLQGRRCVVIGPADDREAIEKTQALREAGAQVHWVQDAGALHESDLHDAFFVLSTPQDAKLSARLRALADERRFLLCCIDQPRYGFVAMAAIVRAGPVRIAISTAGLAPRVGKVLKEALSRALDAKFERFIDCLSTLRERTQSRYPKAEQAAQRRRAMLDAARDFEAGVTLSYPPWFEDELRALGPHAER